MLDFNRFVWSYLLHDYELQTKDINCHNSCACVPLDWKGDASDKPSLAILPLRLNAPSGMDYLKGAYMDVLSARILAAGGIQIEDLAMLRAIIDKHDASEWSEELTKSLAGEIGAGFILESSLSVIADDLSLDVRLVKVGPWNVSLISLKGKGVGAFTEMLEKVSIEARG